MCFDFMIVSENNYVLLSLLSPLFYYGTSFKMISFLTHRFNVLIVLEVFCVF